MIYISLFRFIYRCIDLYNDIYECELAEKIRVRTYILMMEWYKFVRFVC